MRVDWFGVANNAFVVVGVFAFSISGALLAVQKKMDVVGLAGLAVITAVGGGIIRDVLIGAIPPAALVDIWMVGVALVGALTVLLANRWMGRVTKPVLFFDAIGLGVFCVQGAVKAVEFGVGPWGAAVVGMVTGIGGGVLRDVLANDIPTVFRRDSRLYFVPALLGAALTALLLGLGVSHPLALAPVALLVVLLRILSEAFNWRAPHPRLEED